MDIVLFASVKTLFLYFRLYCFWSKWGWTYFCKVMSGGSIKHNSKWDMKEESQHSYDNVQDNAWSRKAGMSFHDKELRSGWFSPKGGGYSSGHKWSAREDNMLKSRRDLQVSSREPLPGSRGSQKEDCIGDYRECFRATSTWDGEGNYSMEMSPGLDDWRQQIRHHSPRSDWNGPHRWLSS